jgi:hypothetical protein
LNPFCLHSQYGDPAKLKAKLMGENGGGGASDARSNAYANMLEVGAFLRGQVRRVFEIYYIMFNFSYF